MKILSFLGARAEVERLTAVVATLTAERDTAIAANSAESPAIEALKADNKAFAEANEQLSKDLTAAQAEAAKVAGLESKITALTASQTDFEAKVEKAASARLLTLTAAAGAPPVTAPADAKKQTDSKTMSRSEFFALSPAKRLEFSKAGGRLDDSN